MQLQPPVLHYEAKNYAARSHAGCPRPRGKAHGTGSASSSTGAARSAPPGASTQHGIIRKQRYDHVQLVRKAASPALDDDVLKLDVGGQRIVAARSTLVQVSGSVLQDMFCIENSHRLQRSPEGAIFLDMDPGMFLLVLQFLRELKMGPRGHVDTSLSSFRPEVRPHLFLLLQHLRLLPRQGNAGGQLQAPAGLRAGAPGPHMPTVPPLPPPPPPRPLSGGPQQQRLRGEERRSLAALHSPAAARISGQQQQQQRQQQQQQQENSQIRDKQSDVAAGMPGGSAEQPAGFSASASAGSSDDPLPASARGGAPLPGPASYAAADASGRNGKDAGVAGITSSSSSSSRSTRSSPGRQWQGDAAWTQGAGGVRAARSVPAPHSSSGLRGPATSQLYYIQATSDPARGMKISVYSEADLAKLSGAETFDIFCNATCSGTELSFTFVCRQGFDDVCLGITTRSQIDCRGSMVPCFGWKSNSQVPVTDTTASSSSTSTAGRRQLGLPLWGRGDSVELLVLLPSPGHGGSPSAPRMVLKVNGRELDSISDLPPLSAWSWYVALYMAGDMSCVTFMEDSYAVYWGEYQVKRFLA